MSTISSPSKTSGVSSTAHTGTKKKTTAKKSPKATKTAAPKDVFDVHSAHALLPTEKLKGVVSTVPGIAEAFPVAKLSEIKGLGLSGDTYLLDGGSLSAMKLQVRRFVDDGKPGMELVLRVDGKELGRLTEAAKKANATLGPLQFRGADLGSDGITQFTSAKGSVTEDTSYSPDDMSSNDDAWVHKVTGTQGGTVELVHSKAALAARGMVRITLNGDDKACQKQLQSFVKQMGLGHILAPPTAKSKERYSLMRALWQAAPGEARKLGKDDLNSLKTADLKKLLKKNGFDDARIKALRFADVAATHFTVIDPEQAEVMIDAGARYLYSTVQKIEHVVSILEGGQKSSFRRYKDGLIIDGMSTNEDFCSGGGAGVFTRVVTQNSIFEGESWTGRRFKVVLKPEVLARTDWFGWPDDMFGQAHGLGKKNFGVDLLDSVDSHGSYQDYNELIFRDAIGPQYIGRIVATSESDRTEMLEALEKHGFEPPDGTPLDQFVVYASNFMQYGRDPFEVSDVAGFVKKAVKEFDNDSDNTTKLSWFLKSGPTEGGHRAKVEKDFLLSDSDEKRDVVISAVRESGQFAMSTEEVESLVEELSKKEEQHAYDDLMRAPIALLSTNSDSITARVKKWAKTGAPKYGGPLGVQNSKWVGLLERLADQQTGDTRSDAYQFAIDTCAKKLLDSKTGGFFSFLKKHPLVEPEDPQAFLKKEINKLEKNPASLELRFFLGQLDSPQDAAEAQLALLRDGGAKAKDLLQMTVSQLGSIGASTKDLAAAFKKLSAKSPVKAYLLGPGRSALIRSGEPSLLDALAKKWSASSSGQPSNSEWTENLEFMLNEGRKGDDPALAWALEWSAPKLMNAHGESAQKFQQALKAAKKLYSPGDAAKFAASAVKSLDKKTSARQGKLQLAWMFVNGTKAQKSAATLAVLRSGSKEATKILEFAKRQQPDKKLPASPQDLAKVALELTGKKGSAPSIRSWLLRDSGPEMLKKADLPTLEMIKKAGGSGGYSVGLGSNSWIEVFDAIGSAKHSGAKETRSWLLETFAKSGMRNGDTKALAVFRKHGIKPADLGFELDDVKNMIKSQVEDMLYEIEDAEWDDDIEVPEGMPDGIKFLLANGGNSVDTKTMNAVLKALPEWQEDYGNSYEPFVERLSYLPASWKKKVETAKKKMDETDY